MGAEAPQPFLWRGKEQPARIGALLIHGFTGSTHELRPLGAFLNKRRGYTVCAPLLKGHGTTPEEMQCTTWVDWYASAREGLFQLKKAGCDRVIVIGLSMGGLLALKIAQNFPVLGVVSLCAPIFVKDKRAPLARYVQYVMPYSKRVTAKQKHIEEHLYVYDRTPVACVVSLQKLIANVKQALPHIHAPALIIQSALDETVDPKSADWFMAKLGSQTKELVTFEKSTHIVTLDHEQPLLHEKISAFIDRLTPENVVHGEAGEAGG